MSIIDTDPGNVRLVPGLGGHDGKDCHRREHIYPEFSDTQTLSPVWADEQDPQARLVLPKAGDLLHSIPVMRP